MNTFTKAFDGTIESVRHTNCEWAVTGKTVPTQLELKRTIIDGKTCIGNCQVNKHTGEFFIQCDNCVDSTSIITFYFV